MEKISVMIFFGIVLLGSIGGMNIKLSLQGKNEFITKTENYLLDRQRTSNCPEYWKPSSRDLASFT